MSSQLLIDSHLHVYETKEQGQSHKDSYTIGEYGHKKDIQFSARSGDLGDALAALAQGGFMYAVIANLFFTKSASDDHVIEQGPGGLDGSAVVHDRRGARDRLISFNHWACSLAREHAILIPFISLDPWVLSATDIRRHIFEMVSEYGARGVKLHPNAQRVSADDRRLWPVYTECASLGIPLIAHAGASKENRFSEPETFAVVLQEFPSLKLVLAHLGGGAWRQTAGLAAAFSNVMFDCCEIINWTGAPNAPTITELSRLISAVGAHRVLLGSDFPWYDPDATAAKVLELPRLAQEQKELILGRNALTLLNLSEPGLAPS